MSADPAEMKPSSWQYPEMHIDDIAPDLAQLARACHCLRYLPAGTAILDDFFGCDLNDLGLNDHPTFRSPCPKAGHPNGCAEKARTTFQ